MNNTIVVKGVGNACTAPDSVVITIDLEALDRDYQKAMELGAKNIDSLTKSLVAAGFDKKAIKTTHFDVRAKYDSHRAKDGTYYDTFAGYEVNHVLKLQFDFSTKKLAKALGAIGVSTADPVFRIRFTVKDPSAVSDEMLKSATENARHKAEILCAASGKELGELLSIDYNWGEINVYSKTRYDMSEACVPKAMRCCVEDIDIEPEDIETSDTATFVWEIK
ncbi:MAG: SIMPL domain-containing protein [Prevotellaceae bacterium]|nr:SIMPL domain-containing protein [Prevotellaceae bacterium]